MSLILNIDTAIANASICLARDGIALRLAENMNRDEHASWLHVTIKKILSEQKLNLSDLKAVAVTIGPGSYTGLRVGLSAAKGLCYALDIPLLTIGTLEMMAYAAKDEPFDLLCPMIDARRQEVFTAVYDKKLNELMKPQALILDANIFDQFLTRKILFFGTGSNKTQSIIQHENAWFNNVTINASSMALLSENLFQTENYADLVYTEPLYLKDFHSVSALPFIEKK